VKERKAQDQDREKDQSQGQGIGKRSLPDFQRTSQKGLGKAFRPQQGSFQVCFFFIFFHRQDGDVRPQSHGKTPVFSVGRKAENGETCVLAGKNRTFDIGIGAGGAGRKDKDQRSALLPGLAGEGPGCSPGRTQTVPDPASPGKEDADQGPEAPFVAVRKGKIQIRLFPFVRGKGFTPVFHDDDFSSARTGKVFWRLKVPDNVCMASFYHGGTGRTTSAESNSPGLPAGTVLQIHMRGR
jgi:hypothetical protein